MKKRILIFVAIWVFLANSALAEKARVVFDDYGKVLEFSKQIEKQKFEEIVVEYEVPADLTTLIIDWAVLIEKARSGEEVVIQKEAGIIEAIFPKIVVSFRPQYSAIMNGEKITFLKKPPELKEDAVKDRFKKLVSLMMLIVIASFLGGALLEKKKYRFAITSFLLAGSGIMAIGFLLDSFAAVATAVAATAVATAVAATAVAVVVAVAVVATAATAATAVVAVVADIDSGLVLFQLMVVYFMPQLIGLIVIWWQEKKK